MLIPRVDSAFVQPKQEEASFFLVSIKLNSCGNQNHNAKAQEPADGGNEGEEAIIVHSTQSALVSHQSLFPCWFVFPLTAGI